MALRFFRLLVRRRRKLTAVACCLVFWVYLATILYMSHPNVAKVDFLVRENDPLHNRLSHQAHALDHVIVHFNEKGLPHVSLWGERTLENDSLALASQSLQPAQSDVHGLGRILRKKLSDFANETSILPVTSCKDFDEPAFVCQEPTCPKLDPDPTVRLRQILATHNHTMIEPYLTAMAESARSIQPSKYIFVTAVDSGYYWNLQALVHNAKTHLFPRVSNYAFVVYNLGLSAEERMQTEKNCNCTVLDFPFDKLPPFVRALKCYTWKPLIVRTLIDKADIVVWLDSSVRWSSNTPLDAIFRRATERGLQLAIDQSGSIAVRTGRQTFTFYGDEPCQYEPHGEVYGTFGIFHNEPFVVRAVLDPWVSCAIDQRCMCFDGSTNMLGCSHQRPRQTNVCHRFDQSSLGIIVSKLYNKRSNLVRVLEGIQIDRGDARKIW